MSATVSQTAYKLDREIRAVLPIWDVTFKKPCKTSIYRLETRKSSTRRQFGVFEEEEISAKDFRAASSALSAASNQDEGNDQVLKKGSYMNK